MQGQLTSGVPYGSLGLPVMQSLVELCDKKDDEATVHIMNRPELARLARLHGLS